MRTEDRAQQERPAPPTDALKRDARVAGLREFHTPSLEAVERRRWQLWGLAAFFIVAMAGGMVLLSADTAAIEAVAEVVPLYVVRVLFVGLAAILGFYLFDKESRLARLTRELVDEKVLSAALSNRLKELSILSEVGKAINQVLDLDDVLRMILRSALDILEAEEGSVMLVESAGEHLRVACAETSSGDSIEGVTVKVGEGIAGWVAQSREPLLISGTPPPHLFKAWKESQRPIASAISVPLIGDNELYGVLNINDLNNTKAFTEYDLRAVGLFAEHAAIAIRNSRLFAKERQTIQRLAEIDKMKSEFIATISHELRTPLTSIIGCAKTIRSRADAMPDAQRDEFLQVIERQGEKLLRMIEEVLSASKIESGEIVPRREAVNLAAVARDVVTAVKTAGAPNPIEVNGPEEVQAFGDSMAFEQILTNLIENAVKYSEDGEAPIEVGISEEPGAVRLEVKDRGVGIDPELLPSVFERFRQIDQSRTRRAGGVGLGLYIVKNLVEANGGRISAVSTPGKGSTFTMIFPKRVEDNGEDTRG